MAGFAGKFNSEKQEWSTPQDFFDILHREFCFTLDVAANSENAKCAEYISEQTDSLKQFWRGTCWMNPPYKQVGLWVRKAYESAKQGATVVCLIPARTNTNWFHEFCLKGEVRFVRGRLKFGNAQHGLPQPLAIVIFRP